MVMGLMGQNMETIKIFLLCEWLYSDSLKKKWQMGKKDKCQILNTEMIQNYTKLHQDYTYSLYVFARNLAL